MAGSSVVELTDDNFESEVLQSDKPVLVDFWAPWCGPCRMIAPTIDELATDNVGKARVGKLNTDDSSSVAIKFGISAIPTLLLFKKGEVVRRFQGVTSKPELQRAIDTAV
ncbi:MAG: thioredoxin [Planctomycetia bacterium]